MIRVARRIAVFHGEKQIVACIGIDWIGRNRKLECGDERSIVNASPSKIALTWIKELNLPDKNHFM